MAAAKVEFIRLSEKPPKPTPLGGWSLLLMVVNGYIGVIVFIGF